MLQNGMEWNGMGSIQLSYNMIVLSPTAQKESYYSWV